MPSSSLLLNLHFYTSYQGDSSWSTSHMLSISSEKLWISYPRTSCALVVEILIMALDSFPDVITHLSSTALLNVDILGIGAIASVFLFCCVSFRHSMSFNHSLHLTKSLHIPYSPSIAHKSYQHWHKTCIYFDLKGVVLAKTRFQASCSFKWLQRPSISS